MGMEGYRLQQGDRRRDFAEAPDGGTLTITPMKPMPIACSLAPEAIAARKAGLLPGLAARAVAIEERPDGLRLRFAPADGLLGEIAAVIDAERRCCRFLQFDVTVQQDGGPIVLSLTGPPGTREFVSQLIERHA